MLISYCGYFGHITLKICYLMVVIPLHSKLHGYNSDKGST
uniref:Uncharacterized protein n=1 Tax=Yersinia enterocolitica W22703 TaxID=913028 RepID=F4N5L9_YEREN|nr:unknown protein [Yersinia enterocolitica W22703]